jgi:ribonucleotide monophosphatase NagD (HAD superfamily)
LSGLSQIAGEYDALVCDVWGVLHDGRKALEPACEALKVFRREFGPVVLLTNAPRPAKDVEELFVNKYGIPLDCYDAIVTSGLATRDDLAERSKSQALAMLHLGPDRDRGDRDARRLCEPSGRDEGARTRHDLRQSGPHGAARRQARLLRRRDRRSL